MKTFQAQAAQGEIMLRRVAVIPASATEVQSQNGRHVVAHSETGHHHVVEGGGARYFSTPDPLVCYLRVEEGVEAPGAVLRHLRPFDTHESVALGGGCYEIRHAREYTPEGFRRVVD